MAIILILMGALTMTIVISFKQKKAKIDALVVKDQLAKLENTIIQLNGDKEVQRAIQFLER